MKQRKLIWQSSPSLISHDVKYKEMIFCSTKSCPMRFLIKYAALIITLELWYSSFFHLIFPGCFTLRIVVMGNDLIIQILGSIWLTHDFYKFCCQITNFHIRNHARKPQCCVRIKTMPADRPTQLTSNLQKSVCLWFVTDVVSFVSCEWLSYMIVFYNVSVNILKWNIKGFTAKHFELNYNIVKAREL